MTLFFFKTEQLTPVRYHRYTSHVTDAFLNIRSDDKQHPLRVIFECLRGKAIKMYLDTSEAQDGSRIITQQWDNKVVIECKTQCDNIVYVGYYDGAYALGLGVYSDSWVKPYNYKPIGYNPK